MGNAPKNEMGSPSSSVVLLLMGAIVASAAEAIGSTVLLLGRGDMSGDLHVTPDEIASLDISYTVAKLMAFAACPWVASRVGPRVLLIVAVLLLGVSCGLAATTDRYDAQSALRAIQGFSGGGLLIAGQVSIFNSASKGSQPLLQALFAIGSVVAPATLVQSLQGWLLDSQSWHWIFFSVVPLCALAAGFILSSGEDPTGVIHHGSFDWIGFSLLSAALYCFTYVLVQGNRWGWFEEPRILWLTLLGSALFLGFIGSQIQTRRRLLIDWSVLRSGNFTFAFLVSFVAGAALFGSAYLIISFSIGVLGFTATETGLLLLPGGSLLVAVLLLAAFSFQVLRLPPAATIPFGIALVMFSMWGLTGSTTNSGASDMMPYLLVRGAGLGLLFLSLTLIALWHLPNRSLSSGIGLFNTSRQLGALIGVACLQTLIEHRSTGSSSVIGADLTVGLSGVAERLSETSAMLTARGIEPAAAGKVAVSLLGRAQATQSIAIGFEAAFLSVAMLFVVAVPLMVLVRVALSRLEKRRAPQEAP